MNKSKLVSAIIFLWGLVIITIQLSSFKFFPAFMNAITMKPLGYYPFVILFILLLIYILKEKQKIRFPFNLEILIILLSILSISTLSGYFKVVNNPFGFERYWAQSIKAYLSLITGLSFFYISYFLSRNLISEKSNRKFIYISIGFALFWGSLQLIFLLSPSLYAHQLELIQRSFAFGRPDIVRVFGFAFEPSWFADQIGIYFLPWLIAAILTKKFLFENKRWIEFVLVLWLLILLLFTYSRSGLFNVLVGFFIVLLIFGREYLFSFYKWFTSKSNNRVTLLKKLLIIIIPIISISITLPIIAETKYVKNLLFLDIDKGLVNYIIQNAAGPRLAYAVSSYKIFQHYPWTGVGFGTAGLYMIKNLPPWSFIFQEISRYLDPATFQLMNPKNMYIRLLAETGLPGFWVFITFMLSILSKVIQMINTKLQDAQFIGIVGLFAWIVLMLRFFTIDSLTFPIMWMTLGMVLGFAARIEDTGTLDEI